MELPERMRKLPVDENGYPIPWFVETALDPIDFRVMGGDKLVRAIKFSLCWVCGQPIGRNRTFVIGPMCLVNRTSAEPPSHHDCALFSAKSCPFLSNPKKRRRESGLPENYGSSGMMITRNPGVALLWTSRTGKAFVPPDGRGILFNIGDPIEVEWYCEGRAATAAEVQHSIDTGLPILRAAAEEDGPKAVKHLEQQIEAAMPLLPS